MTIPLQGHVANLAIVTPVGPLAFASTLVPSIPGYRIRFECERSIEAWEGGKTRITLFNVGSPQRRLLASIAKRSWEVSPVPGALIDARYPGIPATADVTSQSGHARLLAGYPLLQGEVGWGTVTLVRDRRNGATWETRIELRDGAVQRSNAVANKTFPPGTPVPVILGYLGGISGAVPGFLTPTLSDVTLGQYVAAERARDEIKDLIAGSTKSYAPIPGQDGNAQGYDYWIEDGILNVLDVGTALPTARPLIIAEEPGPGAAPLLRRPQPLDGGRYRVVTGLWPAAQLGAPAQIFSTDGIVSTFRVDLIKHVGDTEGNAWRTELTLSTLLP